MVFDIADKLKHIKINSQDLKALSIIFFVLFLTKCILAYFISYPFTPDTYDYIKMAQSFFESNTFMMNGLPSDVFPPLYPMIISVAYIFEDYNDIYFTMQIINAFVTSIVIVPTFLISQKFMDNKNSLIISSIISFLPLNFFFPITFIMSENIYNIFFLFMIYFLHKAITQQSIKWQVISGFFLGLCLLTRYVAFSIIPAVILTLLIREIYYSDNRSIKIMLINFVRSVMNYVPFFSIAFVTFMPWLIRNGLLFGFTTAGIMGGYGPEIAAMETSVSIGPPLFYNLFIETFAHIGALVYASGIIFFVMALYLITDAMKAKQYDKTLIDFVILSISVTLMYVFLASYHNSIIDKSYIRIMPRYIEIALPLIYIVGYIGLLKYQQNVTAKLKPGLAPYFWISLLCMVFLIPVREIYNLGTSTLAPLHRLEFLDTLFNCFYFSSLTLLHVYLIKLLIFILMTYGLFIFYKRGFLKTQYVVPMIMLMLIITNTVGVIGSTIVHETGYSTEIGAWYNAHSSENPGIVLFDEREDIRIMNKIGFWISAPIQIGNVTSEKDVDYILTSCTMDLPVVATEKINAMPLYGRKNPVKIMYLYKN